jgi:GxxExxY protein
MDERDPLTAGVIGAAIEVHRELGPGLLESIYEVCLCRELALRGIEHQRQAPLPVVYKRERLDADLRIDILVAVKLIRELKAVERILPVHEAQLLTYLRLTGIHVGLLLNFNVPVLKNGIKRLVH